MNTPNTPADLSRSFSHEPAPVPFSPPAPSAPAVEITPTIPWYVLWDALVASHVFPFILSRVCLYGRPGTGKSGAPWYSFGGAPNVERITIHNSMAPEDLLGSWTLRANGGGTDTVFEYGPATRTMARSRSALSVLVLDEIDKRGPDVETALHQIADDPTMARVLLPNGETITPGAGFGLVATMNGTPDDLSDALRDRFDLFLCADEPAPGVLSTMNGPMAALVARTIAESPASAWRPSITPRRGLAFSRLARVWGDEPAACAVFGAAAPDVLTMMATVE